MGHGITEAVAPERVGPSPDNFRLIADSAPIPMWLTGLDRQRSFVNRAYIDFLGLDYAQAAAFDWRTIIHADDAERIVAESLAGEASLQPFSLEARYRRCDGQWRWLHSISRPSMDADGRHNGFVGVAYDITDTKQTELALREREAQLFAYVSQSTAGFGQVDLTGRFTLVNDRFCEIVQRSREELMGMTMQQLTHPDDLARNLAQFEQALRDGTPYTHDKRYLRPDGSVVWVNNSVAVIRRDGGEPYGILAITLDISKRRQAEETLRRNAESIRLAVEGAGMATWELDLVTMRGDWSPNRFDILGYPRSPDLKGGFDEWLARIHPDDMDFARGSAERCFHEGVPFQIEYRIFRADNGEERWLQSNGSRIEGDDGHARFVGVSFDVTDRKHAEAALREGEWRFRTIFEQANDYIFTADLDQIVTSCNPAVCAALGYTPEEGVGMSFAQFVDIPEFAQTTAMLQAKLKSGGSTRHTIAVRTRDGRPLTWEVNSRLMLDDAGQPVGLHAIARDVTEARRLEEHQRLLIDELNHRVKNTLAIVQAIAVQNFRGDAASETALGTFQGRLAALSAAHNLLTRDNWTPSSLRTLISETIAPHGGVACQFALDGPDVAIMPKTAVTLALAFHELATNAAKYGALSQPSGSVTIAWTIDKAVEPPMLRLSWRESGGPPTAPPTRRGFGTRMIERGLAAELGGRVTLHFDPAGVRCDVEAPLPVVVA